MINRTVLTVLPIAMLCAWSTLGAGECWHDFLHGICIPDCMQMRCCDDYCAKPLPCARCVNCFCCNDYCRKPSTCTRCVPQFCCDDYCPKPLPCMSCPPCSRYLKCSCP